MLIAAVIGWKLTCDQNPVAAQPQPKPAKIVHHFEPVPYTEGDLAIDTATGLKCKTWEWVCVDKKGAVAPVGTQMYGMYCRDLATMPTCYQVAAHEEVPQ